MSDLRKKLAEELARQFQSDLQNILTTKQGRRVFSYILMRGGVLQADSSPIATGRRSLALELIQACDSISKPEPITGLQTRNLCEVEYNTLQFRIRDKILRDEKEFDEHVGKAHRVQGRPTKSNGAGPQ